MVYQLYQFKFIKFKFIKGCHPQILLGPILEYLVSFVLKGKQSCNHPKSDLSFYCKKSFFIVFVSAQALTKFRSCKLWGLYQSKKGYSYQISKH